ncbi:MULTISPECIES: outer membrane protein [Sphingomonas]|uniref:outer membrane protein n=1 Tax=Sphingomonas TaxID=13687 RepID=UPI0013E0B480|nr:porin family protein [Sphingomonas sp. ABOLF]GLK19972.1 hypothetical protein GCM10017606_07980 [Microbacterium terregens]
MRVLSTATIFLVAAGFAAPASAQEDGSFTGPRVEAIAGWDNFSAGHGESDSEDDFVFGGAIGYDYQMQNIVVGAELELTGAGTSSTVRSYMTPSDLFRVEADRDIYIGARLGYAFTPQFLGYVKAGYTNLRIESTYIPSVPGRNTIDDAADSDGFRAGLGLEYRFSQGFYGKGEYRYSNYGDVRGYDLDVDRNQIVVGLGYRF